MKKSTNFSFYETQLYSPTTLLEKAIKSENIEDVSYSLSRIAENRSEFDLLKMLCLAMPNPPIFKLLLKDIDQYHGEHFKKYKVISNVLEEAAKEDNKSIINCILKYLQRNDTKLSVARKLAKLHPTEMKQVNQANPGMVITYAASRGHLNALNALLNNHSIAKLATWCENLPLRRAQAKLNKAENQELILAYNQIIQKLMSISAVSKLENEQKEVESALSALEKQHPLALTSYYYLRKHTLTQNPQHLNLSDGNDDEEASYSEDYDNPDDLDKDIVTIGYPSMCRLI